MSWYGSNRLAGRTSERHTSPVATAPVTFAISSSVPAVSSITAPKKLRLAYRHLTLRSETFSDPAHTLGYRGLGGLEPSLLMR